ncbi:MAG: T9SS type A sorting domain-containing protein [bacterium]
MKKLITLCLLIVLSITANYTFAQCLGGNSVVNLNTLGEGSNVTFTDPISGNPYGGFAGLINSTMDGNPLTVFCVQLHRNVNIPATGYSDTCAFANAYVQYILNNYYPKNTTNYPGRLGDNNLEAASIQLAFWHYTDNVNANTVTDGTIMARALAIIADADLNGGATNPVITFTIEPGNDPNDFYVRTVDDNGNPIAISNITLSISQGTLTTNNVNTDANGNSPDVTVSGTTTGIITASATMLYAQGRLLDAITMNSQTMVIAVPVYGLMKVTMDFGLLPVELSSFTSTSTGRNVTLSWTTSSEVNNSGFNIERSISGSNDWKVAGNVSGNGTSTTSHNYSFTDRNLMTGSYSYRLKQIDFNGNFEYFGLNSEIEIGTPSAFDLKQNYPNPFNPSTKITFDLPKEGFVSIKIFDNLGREVATVVNEFKTAGYYTVDFNAANLTSGLYFYKMEANGFNKVMKMTLVK